MPREHHAEEQAIRHRLLIWYRPAQNPENQDLGIRLFLRRKKIQLPNRERRKRILQRIHQNLPLSNQPSRRQEIPLQTNQRFRLHPLNHHQKEPHPLDLHRIGLQRRQKEIQETLPVHLPGIRMLRQPPEVQEKVQNHLRRFELHQQKTEKEKIPLERLDLQPWLV